MDKISTNRMVKIGIIVDDIEKAVEYYADLFNIPKPEVKTPKPKNTMPVEGNKPYTWYRGEYRTARCKTAVVGIEPIYIELIEPLDEPSPWTEFKEKHGQGVHYMAFNIDDFKGHEELMEKKGMPIYHKTEKGKERYGYFETASKLGITLEFKEIDKE